MSKYAVRQGMYVPPTQLGSGTPDGTKYLKDDGTWATPAGGSGDSITVNGAAVVDADLDDAVPAAPANSVNVRWQKDASSPANVSANVPTTRTQAPFGSGRQPGRKRFA